MRTGRPRQAPLYVLPHGIEVIGEYAARGNHPYWRVRIRPHRFFPDAPIQNGGVYVNRCRVVLASKLGRALKTSEHAHHRDENRSNDSPRNLALLTAAEHNRHHKVGSKHSASAKAKMSRSMKRAYATGRRTPPTISRRDRQGRIAACVHA